MGLLTDHWFEQDEFNVDPEASRKAKDLQAQRDRLYIESMKARTNKELEKSTEIVENVLTEIPAGFIWEDTTVTRIGRVPNRKGKYLSVETDTQIMMIYISKSGRLTVSNLTDKVKK